MADPELVGLPTLLFFKNGQVVDTLVGHSDEPHLAAKLDGLLAA